MGEGGGGHRDDGSGGWRVGKNDGGGKGVACWSMPRCKLSFDHNLTQTFPAHVTSHPRPPRQHNTADSSGGQASDLFTRTGGVRVQQHPFGKQYLRPCVSLLNQVSKCAAMNQHFHNPQIRLERHQSGRDRQLFN